MFNYSDDAGSAWMLWAVFSQNFPLVSYLHLSFVRCVGRLDVPASPLLNFQCSALYSIYLVYVHTIYTTSSICWEGVCTLLSKSLSAPASYSLSLSLLLCCGLLRGNVFALKCRRRFILCQTFLMFEIILRGYSITVWIALIRFVLQKMLAYKFEEHFRNDGISVLNVIRLPSIHHDTVFC